jgi:hypothetical protein
MTQTIGFMGAKAGWSGTSEPIARAALTASAVEIIERAGTLSRGDIVRLDLAEASDAAFRVVAWDLLRDQLDHAGLQAERLTARNDAWEAVSRSVVALDFEPTPDDGYWRVAGRVGSGAARAARYAACASIAPDRVDPEVTALLLTPWQALAAKDRG